MSDESGGISWGKILLVGCVVTGAVVATPFVSSTLAGWLTTLTANSPTFAGIGGTAAGLINGAGKAIGSVLATVGGYLGISTTAKALTTSAGLYNVMEQAGSGVISGGHHAVDAVGSLGSFAGHNAVKAASLLGIGAVGHSVIAQGASNTVREVRNVAGQGVNWVERTASSGINEITGRQ